MSDVTPITDKKNLFAALISAQERARAVTKDGKNTFHNYKYASAEAIIEEAKLCLNNSGLAVICLGWQMKGEVPDVAPVPGKGDKFCTPPYIIQVHYAVVHTSGETMVMTTESSVVPEAGRPRDKAESAALTMGLGYFLRGLLLLAREDAENSVDQRNDTTNQQSSPVAMTEEECTKACLEFGNAISSSASLDELRANVAKDLQASRLPKKHKEKIMAAYAARKSAFEKLASGG